ncbi:MAG TPA: D-glucuronyl C5-epimerase family protein [Solirubrobacterales bacterium]|nr:D-glucuronyl C5-epimerase family protein [Solirubrobacterales bacterium]
MGAQLSATETRGYPIDFRVKAPSPEWPPAWLASHQESYVSVAQRGLAYYERYLAGDGEAWRSVATSAAEWLVNRQEADGQAAGAWLHRYTFPHTFPLRPPWVSAMAQGEGASLLIRIYQETSEERFAEAALKAIGPLSRTPRAGGAMAQLDHGIFLEEYPTDPPSCVLNGGMFAIWGCFDAARALGDPDAQRLYDESVETLAGMLDRYDTGYWSRYDLFPHAVTNVASPAYHRLHIEQLKAMALLTDRPEFASACSVFEAYQERRLARMRALAHKTTFRILVPRNRLLAGRLPWDRTSSVPGERTAELGEDPAA